MSCASCDRPVKARGLCKQHYEAWLADPANQDKKIRRAQYPESDVMVALFQDHQSYAAVARVIGVSRKTLVDYLEHRSDLNGRCRIYLKPRLSPEEREANDKAAKRRWRRENPERVKDSKRRWAGNRSPEDVRRWNRHNAQQRAALVPKLTPAQALESSEYEEILLAGPCAYCGKRATTIDHIVPIFAGGTDEWDNKCGSCQSCNSSKRDKDLLSFLLWQRERVNA